MRNDEQFSLKELPYGFIKRDPIVKGKVHAIRKILIDQGYVDAHMVRDITGYENPASIIKTLRNQGDRINTITKKGKATVWEMVEQEQSNRGFYCGDYEAGKDMCSQQCVGCADDA